MRYGIQITGDVSTETLDYFADAVEVVANRAVALPQDAHPVTIYIEMCATMGELSQKLQEINLAILNEHSEEVIATLVTQLRTAADILAAQSIKMAYNAQTMDEDKNGS